jgi:hypothetical protein
MDFKVEVGDPTMFGKVIGAGYFSFVVDPYLEYIDSEVKNINDIVLIITKEKDKFRFLKNYLNEEIYIKNISYNNLSEEVRDYLTILHEEYSYDFFYISRLKNCFIDRENNIFFKNIFDYFDNLVEDIGYIEDFNYKMLGDYLPIIKTDIIDIAEDIEKNNNFYFDFIDSILKSFQSIINLKLSSFKIDIHEDQFLLKDNKFYCIDPIIFQGSRL